MLTAACAGAPRRGRDSVRSSQGRINAPLGSALDRPLMSGTRLCCNRCLFCFVDQFSARPSLRVKDDDWRMSMMMGNYVTLTNVSDREIGRIIRRHASPLYISVHAMDPDLRCRILGTPRRLPEHWKPWLGRHPVSHPGGALPGPGTTARAEDTIEKLAAMHLGGAVAGAARVDGCREGLHPLHKYTRARRPERCWRSPSAGAVRRLKGWARARFSSDELLPRRGLGCAAGGGIRGLRRSTTAWACCAFADGI